MTGESVPYRTVHRVKAMTLRPGDVILKAGHTNHSAKRITVTAVEVLPVGRAAYLVRVNGTTTTNPELSVIFRSLAPLLAVEVSRA